jgi:hypothetical protein
MLLHVIRLQTAFQLYHSIILNSLNRHMARMRSILAQCRSFISYHVLLISSTSSAASQSMSSPSCLSSAITTSEGFQSYMHARPFFCADDDANLHSEAQYMEQNTRSSHKLNQLHDDCQEYLVHLEAIDRALELEEGVIDESIGIESGLTPG